MITWCRVLDTQHLNPFSSGNNSPFFGSWWKGGLTFYYRKLLLFFSCPVVSNSLWSHGLKHAKPLCPSPSPKVCPSLCPLHWWCHPAISSSDALFSFCPQSFPASGTFPMSWLLAPDDQNTRVSASASAPPMSIQGLLPKDWLIWSPCCLRDSQDSSATPQLKSINSSALSFLYSLTLISIHDYWKNHSWQSQMDLYWKSNVSAF